MARTESSIAIIGGGIVGVALAQELSRTQSAIVLFEKESGLARHTSGRNSGVIHSGINPKPGTIKARLCVEGSRLLRHWCREHRVPFAESGTLVVATNNSEVPILEELLRRGRDNSVPDVKLLTMAEARKIEPQVRGVVALHSPTGSLVDSLKLTESLAEDARSRGVHFEMGTEVRSLQESDHGIHIETNRGSYKVRYVVNCAGLHADRLAHGMGAGHDYAIAPFRGEYFVIRDPHAERVRSMIYPVPDLRFPFLGVHLTRTLEGTVLVGPNAVPALGREVYRWRDLHLKDLWETLSEPYFWRAILHNHRLRGVAWNELRNSCSRTHFLKGAGRLIDGLTAKDLTLDNRVGIRAQVLKRDGELVEDLVIQKTPHSMHLLNVVSPGMTTCLAFAAWLRNEMSEVLS